MNKNLLQKMIWMFFLTLLIVACSPSAAPSAEVITVISSVPVEVTRIHTVVETVEVTREVVITKLVEVYLTPEPTETAITTATPTLDLLAAPVVQVVQSPTIDPGAFKENKTQGYTPFMVTNSTENNLTLLINGPEYHSIPAPSGKSVLVVISEGSYVYSVWRAEQFLYDGIISLTNPDKHELVLGEAKAVFKVP